MRSGRGPESEDGAEPVERLSLDRLSQAFARAIGEPVGNSAERSGGGTVAGDVAQTDEEHSTGAGSDGIQPALLPALDQAALLGSDRPVDAHCPLGPRSIAEAILFVGHPENQPLSSRLIAALMRGVSPDEVDRLIQELNAEYAAQQAPYEIAVVSGGYALQLRSEFDRLRNKLYGRVREARLSQAAIEVLALVAYNQPVGRERIDQLRGKPSAPLLSHLVRRDLLSVERAGGKSRALLYRTTERFLDVFGLDSLHDLPQADSDNPVEL
jgi:segregation and condensation protein B